MRSRITRTLVTVAAAGATATALAFAVAGAAGAVPVAKAPHASQTLGTASYSPPCRSFQMVFDVGGCAGYVATGRNFRFAQSLVSMPAVPGDESTPIRFVALGSADSVAGAGVISCAVALDLFAYTCPEGDDYAAFGATAHQSFIFFSHFVPLSPVFDGDGLFVSIYDDRVGNEVHFVLKLPDGTTSAFGVDAHGAIYTMAAAMANWSGSTPAVPAQPTAHTRLGQFFQGRFTTASGQQGTFTGPWTLSPIEVTSNGFAPPDGTLISAPGYLWNDGNGFRHLPSDAFGVWLNS